MQDEEKSYKKLIIIAIVAILCLAGAATGGFFAFKKIVAQLPLRSQQKLASQGITFAFKDQGVSRTGTSVDIYNFTISGKSMKYKFSGKGIGANFTFGFLPLLSVHFRITQPVIEKNPDYVESTEKAAPQTSSRLLSILSPLARLIHFTFEIGEFSFPEFGLSNLNATAWIPTFKFGGSGITDVSFFHELQLSTLDSFPLFPGLSWTGTTLYRDKKIVFENHGLGLGPLATFFSGNYDPASGKWSAEISNGTGVIKHKEQVVNPKNGYWLSSVTGELGVKISLQGVGTDPNSLLGEGSAYGKNLLLGMNHSFVRGNVKSDFELSFKKTTALEVAAKMEADFTEALIINKDLFRKTKDVPLTLKLEVLGNDHTFEIKSGEFVFNNLKSSLGGSWTYLPQKTANLKFEIPPVVLSGWQQFFPKFPSLIAKGSLAASGSYSGSTDDWRTAVIDLNLQAQNLKIPILKNWLPTSELMIEGLGMINSDTKLNISSGEIKTLATNTQLNFKDTKISYRDLFLKEDGTPLLLDLDVSSTKDQADIKKGLLNLGDFHATTKGKISNFAAPIADVSVSTDMMDIEDIVKFAPILKSKTILNPKGELSVAAKIQGPITSKTGPDYSADMLLKKFSFQYLQEEKKKKIEVTDISGPISIKPGFLQTKDLLLQTKSSEGFLSMSVENFTEPQVHFNFRGNHFKLSEFYDQPKAKPVENIAIAATARPADDFRKIPLLSKLKAQGEATLKTADLDYAKVDNLLIKLNYDKLILLVEPLSFNIYGGSISTTTRWDGTEKDPVTEQTLQVTGVDANQFLTSYSEKAKDLVLGKLNTSFTLNFSGIKPEEIQKSLKGKGEFSLKDGYLKTIRLTQEPLESLKKIPLISNKITKTDWDEKFNDFKGMFSVENSKLLISNILFKSPYFEGSSQSAAVGFDQSLVAAITLIPNETLLPDGVADMIRDENGKPSIPILLGGQLKAPTIAFDSNTLLPRTKDYLVRQAEKEKERELTEIKNKAAGEAKKILKNKLGNFLK